jgi:hypothetical protein
MGQLYLLLLFDLYLYINCWCRNEYQINNWSMLCIESSNALNHVMYWIILHIESCFLIKRTLFKSNIWHQISNITLLMRKSQYHVTVCLFELVFIIIMVTKWSFISFKTFHSLLSLIYECLFVSLTSVKCLHSHSLHSFSISMS